MCFATNHRCHNCTHVCRFVFSFSCAVVVYVESIVLFSLTYYLLVCSAFVCTMLTTDLCFRNEIRLNSKYKLQTIQFSFAHWEFKKSLFRTHIRVPIAAVFSILIILLHYSICMELNARISWYFCIMLRCASLTIVHAAVHWPNWPYR